MSINSARKTQTVRLLCAVALIFLVIFRALPFLFYPGIHFDSDQATFGLMAIHLSQFKSFPIFMYGQKYMLAVQSWWAAPFFLAFGASMITLKISTLVINGLTVLCLFEFLRKELRFTERDALVIALPIAVPALALSQQWMNASGGHIEPMLYAIVIYWVRNRGIAFPLISVFAVLHREYCLAAVLAAWVILYLEHLPEPNLKKKAVSFFAAFFGIFLAVQIIARNFSAHFFGASPPFKFNHNLLLFTESLEWIGRHLALILGATREVDPSLAIPFRGGNMLAGVSVFALLAMALYSVKKIEFKRFTFGLYIFLICLLVCGFYFLKLQTHDGLGMRYIVLAGFIPVACAAWVLSSPNRALRMGGYGAIIFVSIFHAYDLSHYWYTLNKSQPIDLNGRLASELEKRGITHAIAPYWKAYDISFRTQEKIKVASSEQIRIPEYQTEFTSLSEKAMRVDDPACKGTPGAFQIEKIWFCKVQ